jgi:hypothetical protein
VGNALLAARVSTITSGRLARICSVLACTASIFTSANTLVPPATSSMSSMKPVPPLAIDAAQRQPLAAETSSVRGRGLS